MAGCAHHGLTWHWELFIIARQILKEVVREVGREAGREMEREAKRKAGREGERGAVWEVGIGAQRICTKLSLCLFYAHYR